MRPRVSVVVPVYNVDAYLDRCVASLLASSLGDIEIVLVNDGSTDKSGFMCDAIAATDSRVRVIHQANGGLSAARNAGLSAASGIFVVFIDGDDWVEPSMLSDLLVLAEETKADVVVSGCIVDVEDATGRLHSSTTRALHEQTLAPGMRNLDLSEDFLALMGYVWNKLYLRRLLNDYGLRFEEGLSLVEDVEFNSRVVCAATSVVVSSGAFVHYVQRPRVTLGTRNYVDFLSLRLRAVAALRAMLLHWGVSEVVQDEHLRRLQYAALRSAVRRTSQHRAWGLHEKGAHLRQVRALNARDLTHLSQKAAGVRWHDRLYAYAFFSLPPVVLLMGERLRQTLQGRRLRAKGRAFR